MAVKYEVCRECNYVMKRARINSSVRDIFNTSNKCELCSKENK
jgi:hypothetical protein